jgi:hypothetical protein
MNRHMQNLLEGCYAEEQLSSLGTVSEAGLWDLATNHEAISRFSYNLAKRSRIEFGTPARDLLTFVALPIVQFLEHNNL